MQKLSVNLLFTSSWINGHFDSFFKNSNITSQQYNVLRILRGQYPKPCSIKIIKERMLDKMSDASRIVDKLVLKNTVSRKTCPNDRRLADVIITNDGLKLLATFDKIDDHFNDIYKTLTDKEVIKLNKLLDKLRG